jgi:hypothetical protein
MYAISCLISCSNQFLCLSFSDPAGHYAEHSGYFETTEYLATVDRTKETTYYDSVSGKPLFIAPRFGKTPIIFS